MINLKQQSTCSSIAYFLIQLVLILLAFYEMIFSDAFYVPYFLVLILAVMSLFMNYLSVSLGPKMKWLVWLLAFLFSMMMMMANYELWEDGGFINLLLWAGMIIGGFFAWCNILSWIAANIGRITWEKAGGNWTPWGVFLVAFCITAAVNLTILFQCKYPGNLSPDSTDQINQALTGHYINHHPFWNTLMIKLFMSIGMGLFHEINASVAFYSVCSIIIMAAVFAFAACTMTEFGVPKWLTALSILFFVSMPYHMMYSMTVGKDAFFGACCLLFIVCFFRCVNNMPHSVLNIICFFISGVGLCLFRNNGFFVMALTGMAFFAFRKSLGKKVLIAMTGILVVGFAMKYPLVKSLGIGQPDFVESLSIPIQQIARDVIENDDFSEKQIALLEEIVDLERIPDTYSSFISDPIKNLIREKNNQGFLREHIRDYAGLYMTRLLQHPLSYVKAWIDQTKGYWNSGYAYWMWIDSVFYNNYGIKRTVKNEDLNGILTKYLAMFQNNKVLRLFIAIGFFDWLLLTVLFIGIIRHDKIGVLMTIPCIMNVATLLIATPVYSEIRYNYAVFCSIPFILVLNLRSDRLQNGGEAEDGQNSSTDPVLE